ncbi:hypothetical protein [Amycolatopsis pigmentata]|uniref:WXG100 family type VII secretion target n=1 Tax=Amycolatopsis pigmentata TaxID=450801 RepID=A0ABW5G272_9PSEU
MAQTTQIDHSAFQQIIQKHADVQSYIQQQQAQIRSEVEQAQAQNSGAMINSLVSVHDDWDAKMNDINNNLNQMIDAMKTTLSKLQAQDSQNTIK